MDCFAPAVKPRARVCQRRLPMVERRLHTSGKEAAHRAWGRASRVALAELMCSPARAFAFSEQVQLRFGVSVGVAVRLSER